MKSIPEVMGYLSMTRCLKLRCRQERAEYGRWCRQHTHVAAVAAVWRRHVAEKYESAFARLMRALIS